jgi:hypothetical protein
MAFCSCLARSESNNPLNAHGTCKESMTNCRLLHKEALLPPRDGDRCGGDLHPVEKSPLETKVASGFERKLFEKSSLQETGIELSLEALAPGDLEAPPLPDHTRPGPDEDEALALRKLSS